MNTNEKCLLNYLSNYSSAAMGAGEQLIGFLSAHKIKMHFNNLNPILNIIDEMEFLSELNYNLSYEEEKLD